MMRNLIRSNDFWESTVRALLITSSILFLCSFEINLEECITHPY